MPTRKIFIVVLIIVLVPLVAFWSKLRFTEAEDYQLQRWRVEDHPAFRKDS